MATKINMRRNTLRYCALRGLSEEERVSIGFNLMFSAFTENLSKPLW